MQNAKGLLQKTSDKKKEASCKTQRGVFKSPPMKKRHPAKRKEATSNSYHSKPQSHEGDITMKSHEGDITTQSHEGDITTKLHEGDTTAKSHQGDITTNSQEGDTTAKWHEGDKTTKLHGGIITKKNCMEAQIAKLSTIMITVGFFLYNTSHVNKFI
jgi:hypothetical protein